MPRTQLFRKEGGQLQFIMGNKAKPALIGNDVSVLSGDAMNHWHESEQLHWSVDSPNGHGVSNEVISANTMIQTIMSPEDLRRENIWKWTLETFLVMASRWEEGAKVVVSSTNTASNAKLITNHPSKLAHGATKGLLFCSTLLGNS